MYPGTTYVRRTVFRSAVEMGTVPSNNQLCGTLNYGKTAEEEHQNQTETNTMPTNNISMIGLLPCLAAVLLFLQAGPSFGFSHPSFLIPSPYTTLSPLCRTASNNEEPHSILRELSARVYRQRHQYARLDVEQATYADGERELPEAVHIILFRVDAPQRHVHTIDVGHQERILAFESGAECAEFARMLRDLEFSDPSVSNTPLWCATGLGPLHQWLILPVRLSRWKRRLRRLHSSAPWRARPY